MTAFLEQTGLMKEKEAARYLGVSEEFLQGDRYRGATIPFVRVGRRGIRYTRSALDQYIAARTQPAVTAK